jgi:cholesterol transport system auxiliary component
MKRRVFLSHGLLLAVTGCALAPRTPGELAYFDLGPQPPATGSLRLARSLALDHASAGPALQTQSILYRLMYREPAQLHAYAHSRWSEPPAALVTERLRAALGAHASRGVALHGDGVASELLLRTELQAFEQVVESASAASAVVRLRASLIETAARRLQAQSMLAVSQPCSSVDALGTVRALRAATDHLAAQLVAWLAAHEGAAGAG